MPPGDEETVVASACGVTPSGGEAVPSRASDAALCESGRFENASEDSGEGAAEYSSPARFLPDPVSAITRSPSISEEASLTQQRTVRAFAVALLSYQRPAVPNVAASDRPVGDPPSEKGKAQEMTAPSDSAPLPSTFYASERPVVGQQ